MKNGCCHSCHQPEPEPGKPDDEACSGAGAGIEAIPLHPNAEGNIRTVLHVAGMDCADEVEALERVLRPLGGVREVRVNLMGGKVTLLHDGSVSPATMIAAIGRAGMKAAEEDAASAGMEMENQQRTGRLAVGISGVFTGLGLLLERIHPGNALLADASFVAAIVAGGWLVAPKAWRALRHRALDMNVLMSVAVVGALAIHQWSEAAAVTFLFALSELLEAFSLTRARRAVKALMQLAPETALLREESGNDRGEGAYFREVPVESVAVGSTIAVKSGSRIPLDGVIATGASAIDQAPITGESMPVDKGPGDAVFAGTINGAGSLELVTTKGFADTTLARIVHLIEEAQSQKAPAQRFVDRFARYYTPSVMAAALLFAVAPPLLFGAEWLVWLYRGLVLLVIACPCALVISTPVSVVSGLTAMARRGVLIKGGAVLESVGKLKALAVDKTGTITEGKPRVRKVIPVNSYNETEILRIAAAIDTHSEHPLAQAVVRYAMEKNIPFPRSEDYRASGGRGAEAVIDGHHYFVGNHRFTHEMAVCSPEIERQLALIEADAQSVVIVGHRPHADCTGEVLGILAVGDAIREHAPAAIAALHRMGIGRIVMLSGDNQRTASAIAAKAGIDEAHGDLLPDQKIERIKALLAECGTVGMIGDGVNDAPAMAAATVGIAMGQGTDTALETADMALMQDDLSQVAEAIHLGRRTVRVIQCNIAFALSLKAVFLVLALTGHTSLWLAIAADTGATLLVIANALRLLRH